MTTSEPSENPPYAQPVNLARWPIEEDLYCLSCGYNVRGLTGDPVRCPECGDENERAALKVPAPLIKAALRSMETAPTFCAGAAIMGYLAGGIGLLIWLLEDRRVFGTPAGSFVAGCWVVTGVCTVAWPLACFQMRRSFDARPGWARVLGGFHLAGFLLTLYYPMLLTWAFVLERYSGPPGVSPPRGLGWIVLAVSLAAGVWGLRVYATARRRMARMRRETAVRIAAGILERALASRRSAGR